MRYIRRVTSTARWARTGGIAVAGALGGVVAVTVLPMLEVTAPLSLAAGIVLLAHVVQRMRGRVPALVASGVFLAVVVAGLLAPHERDARLPALPSTMTFCDVVDAFRASGIDVSLASEPPAELRRTGDCTRLGADRVLRLGDERTVGDLIRSSEEAFGVYLFDSNWCPVGEPIWRRKRLGPLLVFPRRSDSFE